MDEELTKCRLCNYQSDKRLMLKIFDEPTEYHKKIKKYLNLKLTNESDVYICFHCSQTIDNFHNFATKIDAIQRIIFPVKEIQNQFAIIEEPQVVEVQEIEIQPPSVRQTRKSRLKNEKIFEELKKNVQVVQKKDTINDEALSDLQSNRSFDLDDAEVIFNEASDDEELSDNLRDPEDPDFPSAVALAKIPSKLIENGSLIYKGKFLMQLLSTFYNTACKLCTSKRFKSITKLFEHYRDSHVDVEPFVTCCSMQLTKMPTIIYHFVRHIDPDAFKCGLCDYAVSRPKFLEIHMQTHLPEGEKPLQCDHCSRRFIWKGALKNHLMAHQSDRREFSCTICQRKYQTAGSLSAHRKSAHANTQKTRKLCEICSKSFSTYTAYKEHLTTHSADREKFQLKCNICGKWLKNKRCLKSHLLLHTGDERKCNLCDYVTKKEKLLDNHMKTKHSDDKNFKCEIDGCERSFKVKRALTIHIAQQHGGKSTARKCEFCGKEFASSTNYYTHRKNLHRKELEEAIERRKEEEKLKRIKVGLEDLGDGGERVRIIEETIFEASETPIVITIAGEEFS